MLAKLLLALGLMASCVIIHASGVALALRQIWRINAGLMGFWRQAWVSIRLAALMILCHMVEIAAWAAAYVWYGAIVDLPSAIYFSAVTYTTTGYGDIVLPGDWRLVGGVEALTGILMCGWSTAFFFWALIRVTKAHDEERR